MSNQEEIVEDTPQSYYDGRRYKSKFWNCGVVNFF